MRPHEDEIRKLTGDLLEKNAEAHEIIGWFGRDYVSEIELLERLKWLKLQMRIQAQAIVDKRYDWDPDDEVSA